MEAPMALIRKDRGKRAYRLRCRFRINRFPSERWLEQAKYAAAESFVKDMRKQGYEYLDAHGFKMTGPFVPLQVVNLPSRSAQARWHMASRAMLPRLRAGERFRAGPDPYTMTVPSLDENEQWEYELAGVFVHETIFCETPDPHEEKEVLKNR